ncbi:scavenger receptor class B member 1 [Condylostylus longicornis]|uniref:scavenger receptor class B member 1 n=1 Tax=Condylostylus longicornis TaxID=2530218 RepID=UPI00244DE11A|nr:scavenger receptor class B member 1 [Condylostylus longicornis]
MKLFNKEKDSRGCMRFSFLGLLFFIIASLIIIINPIKLIVDDQLSLRPGSLLFKLWEKPPLEVFIRVYAYNITNFENFYKGIDKKIKLEEVGPYVYQEFLENHNASFSTEHNTVTFQPTRRVKFIREMSIGDPKSDRITVPNIPYMGVTTAVSEFSLLGAIAVRTLMRTLRSQVILNNITVDEYFWGYDDPLVSLASKIIPNVIHFKKFGLLDRMFDEGKNTVTMNLPHKSKSNNIDAPISERLVSNDEYNDEQRESFDTIVDVLKNIEPEQQEYEKPFIPLIRDFSIDNFNGQKGLKQWGYAENNPYGNSECNTLAGTYDGTLFPRNITEGETFRIYRKTFCRTLPIVYSHPGEVDGVEAYFFKLADNAFDSNIDDPQSSCFCRRGVCLRKGLGNITPCYYNIPAAVSFPHFYNGDPSLLDSIEGLDPSEEKHGSEIVLQPQLGIPMKVRSRIQLNLLMGEIKFNSDMRPFRNIVLPIIWIDMGVESLTPGLLFLLYLLFSILPYAQITLIIILYAGGIAAFLKAILYIRWIPNRMRHLHEKALEITSIPAGVCKVPIVIVSGPAILSLDNKRLSIGGGKILEEEMKCLTSTSFNEDDDEFEDHEVLGTDISRIHY